MEPISYGAILAAAKFVFKEACKIGTSFWGEFDNAPNRLREFKDSVETLQYHLEDHEAVLRQCSLEGSRVGGLHKTLAECKKFLKDYKSALRERRGLGGHIGVAMFAYEEDRLARLDRHLQRGYNAIFLHCFNILM
jgi:hypothetical protein